jgi:hypothetical protein
MSLWRKVVNAIRKWLDKTEFPMCWPQITERDVLCALLEHGALSSQDLFREITRTNRWSSFDRLFLGWSSVNPVLHWMSQPTDEGGLVHLKKLQGPMVDGKVIVHELWFLTRPKGYTAALAASCGERRLKSAETAVG